MRTNKQFKGMMLLSLFLMAVPTLSYGIEVFTHNIKVQRGDLGPANELSRLNHMNQTGGEDDSTNYIDIMPNSNEVFRAQIKFKAAELLNSEGPIFLRVNSRGEAYEYQKWKYIIKRFATRGKELIGDNSKHGNWVWHETFFQLPTPLENYVNSNGDIVIQLVSPNAYDKAQIDYLAMVDNQFDDVGGQGPNTPPQEEEPPLPPTEEPPSSEEPPPTVGGQDPETPPQEEEPPLPPTEEHPPSEEHPPTVGDAMPLHLIQYWAYQIQRLEDNGAIDKIVQSHYDMVVIDPTETHDTSFDAKHEVSRIKNSKASDGVHRKTVIAYLDIGEAEEWRWYWGNHQTYEENGRCQNSYITEVRSWAPWVIACDPDGWAGNYPVAYWDQTWRDIVIYGIDPEINPELGTSSRFASMIDEALKAGFDGIYLDWVEAFEMSAVYNTLPGGKQEAAVKMIEFIRDMRDYARQFNPEFVVIQQNAASLINYVSTEQVLAAIDGIAQEGIWWEGYASDGWNYSDGYDIPVSSGQTNWYLGNLEKYHQLNLPIFACEYALDNADSVYQTIANATDWTSDIKPYASRRSLSKLTTTPPPGLSP